MTISICHSENMPVVWVDGEDTDDAAALYVMYASYKAARTETRRDAFVYVSPFLSKSLYVLFFLVCALHVFLLLLLFLSWGLQYCWRFCQHG